MLHHALTNVCEPYFEKWLIFDTYACRKEKGQFKAVRRAQEFARQHEWFLKADVRKFFDSVPHDKLKTLLRRKFKDDKLLYWFDRIIDSYETTPGHGLPIGNLTSQYFANFYLDPLDRFVKETLRIKDYVRYMDDFALWGHSKTDLKEVRRKIVAFASERLGLDLKQAPYLNHARHGMDFLGMRVFPDAVRLNRRSKMRFVSKMRHYEWLLACGHLTEADFKERVTALTAFVQQADTLEFRRNFFSFVDEASSLVAQVQFGLLGCRSLLILQRLIFRAGMAEVRCLPAARREGLLRQPFPPYKNQYPAGRSSGAFHLGNRRQTSGSNRNIRGGSWNNNAKNARCGNANWNNPDNANNNNGFRAVCR